MSSPTASGPPSYPGERLGLPAEGPGSVAGWGARLLALALDWTVATLLVVPAVGVDAWLGDTRIGWLTMAVFVVEATLLTSLSGGSFGQLVTRVRIVRVDGRPLLPLHALLRTVLICLVVPPLVFNRDRRGLHDLAAKTVSVRR